MRDWRQAWQAALYSPGGFFARGERPSAHFRTSPLVGPELAEALLELLARVDFALGGPAALDFVDVGAGGGELSAAVHDLAPPALRRRLCVTAVEFSPPAVPAAVRVRSDLPDRVVGLLVGHEWLDSIPCRIAEVHSGQIRAVHVDDHGTESTGPAVTGAELEWLRRWWPAPERAEIGLPRDEAWADAVGRVRAGAALAVDYGHVMALRPREGTLTGYLAGRQVRPIPDGNRDLTAHVAMDSCAAAAGGGVITSQATALAALGLSATAPASGLAATDPLRWLTETARSGRIAELTDPAGLGGFHWLLHGSMLP
ncbi:SAM-dependent methyltransferase [Allokutzneria sp. A3M-2-11 16]|uniref:SAM-dependent methyltransferase n=1 Tax=Allokutzneria sp. A3M-2-11 16 TaxID=2962043 RepID=UPI0020B66FB9|nr:SAM-dependent methyltransferase [Allokutzneria sp. A3M-2-11 16]MCP3799927.1 SAM-dependent methyltransferase [Allokutzneria sp. A3M-2-11 16]